jgi:hypothetical protein
VLDQCIQLPGEISTLVLDHVRLACSSRGCGALSQLQRVIRVDCAADSIVELLALRLDGQGTDLSTPWPQELGRLILDVMWAQVKEAWRTKQEWKVCTELSMAVQERWEQAKFSMKMCRLLSNVGTLYLHQLQTTAGRGLRWEEIRSKKCAITKAEYSQLISHYNARKRECLHQNVKVEVEYRDNTSCQHHNISPAIQSYATPQGYHHV